MIEETRSPWRLEALQGGEVVRVAGRHSRELIVAFTSERSADGFDYMEQIVESRSDGLLLRDNSRHWFLSGVPGVGSSPNDIASLILRIGSDYDRIITIGHSMGGYAAFLFAHLVKADRAVGIVPQMRVGLKEARRLGDDRFDADFERIDHLPIFPTLLSLDKLRLNPETRFTAIYGSQDRIDKTHTALAMDAGIHVMVLENCDHDGAIAAVSSERMLSLLL